MNTHNKKKLLSAIMGMSMAVSLAVPTFAAGITPYAATQDATITIDGVGTQYSAWKLFNVTSSGLKPGIDHEAIGHVCSKTCYSYVYEINGKYSSQIAAAINAVDTSAHVGSDASIQAWLKSPSRTPDQIRSFANTVYASVKAMPADLTTSSKELKGSEGYYLIAETGTVAGNDTRSEVLLDTTLYAGKNITIKAKESVPELDKTVNDKEGTLANKGETLNFKIDVTLPNNLGGYKDYVANIHDKYSDGLIPNKESITVKLVNGSGNTTPLTNVSDYKLVFGDKTISMNIADLIAVMKGKGLQVGAGYHLVMEYTATVDDTFIANHKTDNSAHFEFSNDPAHSGDGSPTGNTPDDKTPIYNLSVIVKSEDEAKNPLPGAEIKFDSTNNLGDKKECDMTPNPEDTEFVTHDLGKYDKDYTFDLTETKAPDGYMTNPDWSIKVTPTFDENGNLTDLKFTDETDPSLEHSVDLGSSTITIILPHNPGQNLPSTGGVGTTMLYISGGIALAGGLYFLLRKKKENPAE